ncbi:MAG TPA: hypothetical protein VI958_10885, partial [Acidobacteriota bacterium]
ILALAASYTKLYFLLSFGAVLSFVFLFVSKKKAAEFALFFLALFVICFFVIRRVFPLYFFDTILVNASVNWLTNEHLFDRLCRLVSLFAPMLFVSAVLSIIAYRDSAQRPKPDQARFAISLDWRHPLIQPSFDYSLYLAICGLAAFVLLMGRQMGSRLDYVYQLILPAFACCLFQAFHHKQKLEKLLVLIVLANLFMWQRGLLAPSMLEQKNSAEWARLFSYVRSSSNVLNSAAEASEMVHLGLSPIDSGQTILYYETKPYSGSLLSDTSYEDMVADGYLYTRFVDESIQDQKFDLVVWIQEKGIFYHARRLEKYYQLVDEIELSMPQDEQRWTVLIWKPKLK